MELAAVLSAFGLSGAAGLNAYVPLMTVSILGRLGLIELTAPFDQLTRWWAMTLIGVLLAVEVVVDKIPGADHVNDLVQTLLRPTAGALLFASASGVLGRAHPSIALGCGLVLALSVHATKSVARPVVNATTLGAGAPVISAVEDVASVAASLVAVFVPLLVLVFAAAFLLAALSIWSRWRRQRVERSRVSPLARGQ